MPVKSYKQLKDLLFRSLDSDLSCLQSGIEFLCLAALIQVMHLPERASENSKAYAIENFSQQVRTRFGSLRHDVRG